MAKDDEYAGKTSFTTPRDGVLRVWIEMEEHSPEVASVVIEHEGHRYYESLKSLLARARCSVEEA